MNTTNFAVPLACTLGCKELAFGIPAPLALFLTVPLSVAGTLLNGFALVLLARQKQFTNQDVYVSALSAFGMVMAGPCLFLFVYGNVKQCYDFPQVVSDLRIFLVQLSAGVSIWLVVLISVDRLMMLYFNVLYPIKVTKTCTIAGIMALIIWYIAVCGSIDTSPYFFGINKVKPLSLHPRYTMVASFVESPTRVSYALNLMRMVTDRMLPWVVCTATYIVIFCLRDRRKRKVKPAVPPTISTALKTVPFFLPSFKAPTPKPVSRPSIDQRTRKSRFLVVGITASLFVCLTPETIFDVSSYIFGTVLRTGVWEIFGVVWYIQTILNPVIYITSFPNLHSNARHFFKRMANHAGSLCTINAVCSRMCKKPTPKK